MVNNLGFTCMSASSWMEKWTCACLNEIEIVFYRQSKVTFLRMFGFRRAAFPSLFGPARVQFSVVRWFLFPSPVFRAVSHLCTSPRTTGTSTLQRCCSTEALLWTSRPEWVTLAQECGSDSRQLHSPLLRWTLAQVIHQLPTPVCQPIIPRLIPGRKG